MKSKVLGHIVGLFDAPVIQNNLRGIFVEAMVAELLGTPWKLSGADWAGWDIENDSGSRIEVKQSARQQTWGRSKSVPRYSIAIARGHYHDGVTYVENITGERLADLYVFAWHEGDDQRDQEQWKFFVVPSQNLPRHAKTIGLTALHKLAVPTNAQHLAATVEAHLFG